MSLIHVKPGDCSPLTISWLSIFKYLNDDFISLRSVCKEFKQILKFQIEFLDFKEICFYNQFPDEFIIENIEFLPMYEICKYQKMNDDVIDKIWSKLSIDNRFIICFYQNISYEKIDLFVSMLSQYKFDDFFRGFFHHKRNIPSWFLEKYLKSNKQIDYGMNYGPLSKDYLLKYDIIKAIHFLDLPESFLVDLYNNNIITLTQMLNANGISNDFIEKYAPKEFDWLNRAYKHKLPLNLFDKYIIEPFLHNNNQLKNYDWYHMSLYSKNVHSDVVNKYANYIFVKPYNEYFFKGNILEDWLISKYFAQGVSLTSWLQTQKLPDFIILTHMNSIDPETFARFQITSDNVLFQILSFSSDKKKLFKKHISESYNFKENFVFLQKHHSTLLNPYILSKRKDIPVEIKYLIRHKIISFDVYH